MDMCVSDDISHISNLIFKAPSIHALHQTSKLCSINVSFKIKNLFTLYQVKGYPKRAENVRKNGDIAPHIHSLCWQQFALRRRITAHNKRYHCGKKASLGDSSIANC